MNEIQRLSNGCSQDVGKKCGKEIGVKRGGSKRKQQFKKGWVLSPLAILIILIHSIA